MTQLESALQDATRALWLQDLLSAGVSAAWHAGEVIRQVVAENVDLGMVNKADDKYDPQTVADRRSQQRMIHALRQQWPHLLIVGEEGELAQPDAIDAVHADLSVLQDVELSIPHEWSGELDPKELVVWIDPLDGTKKFAEKKYDEVSVLLGIAYHRRPIAGVMHLPFHGDHGVTYWGGKGIGLFRSTHVEGVCGDAVHELQTKPAVLHPSRPLHITTSTTPCPRVEEALRRLTPKHIKTGGATGTMVLSVITGESDAFFRFRNATKRWDICAVEPLINAFGGAIVDKHGRVYEYDPNGHDNEYDNEHGLLATISTETQTLFLTTMEEIEVLRTLDGQVMTPQWLHKHVFPSAHSVERCDVVPKTIRRGKQSIVAKLRVTVIDAETKNHVVKPVFLKRYVKAELPPRSERNWKRDLQSYRAEANFYGHVHEHLASQVGLIPPIAVFYRRDAHGNETGDSFIVFLEDVLYKPEPSQVLEPADRLGRKDTEMALTYLAKLHASAIKSKELRSRVETHLWHSGAWWSFEKRGQVELDNAPVVWAHVLSSFQSELEAQGTVITDDLSRLDQRMMQHAAYISAQIFGGPSEDFAAFKTLVHGDFKTANMFFNAESRQVTAFDWQWAGVGLGVLDVANLMNTSVDIESLTPEAEEDLLRFYYNHFLQELRSANVEAAGQASEPEMPGYSFAAFQRHYMLASLEYARVLLANFWDDTTPASCLTDAHKTNWGLGYRSLPHVLRMIRLLDNGLRVVELEQTQ
ncbi:hypothetical protein Poli38472_010583 [Pythium oligandrum]|uniref:3'(2'),5'-bisphosphate nucleotidase 1 n=1 Tax=Pythium oligandrum TaxID=41045 RepID=A0A8K1C399_PYTOL|nr:hypothetical protein Poli38472_010583 [Pythium oligandrum]|eukprot:TMW55701.1 hypothetical protein Poli38472_010583 [Pythium oligandrum]